MQQERMLVLEGGRNFRDMGGYPTADGRHTRWGRLYRSASMASLTDADFEKLTAIGLRAVCDLRDSGEREKGATAWHRVPNLTYWSRDYEVSLGNLMAVVSSGTTTYDEAMETMVGIYRALPTEQAPAYRQLFSMLAEGHLPLVFNCSAGKDRTGVGAAIVLSALAVPEAVILEDYALTNQAFAKPLANNKEHPHARPKMSPEVEALMGGTHPGFMEAAFSSIDAKYGSFQSYLRDELGVSDEKLREVQANLLE